MPIASRHSLVAAAGCVAGHVTLGWPNDVQPFAVFGMEVLPFTAPPAGAFVLEQERTEPPLPVHQKAIARASRRCSLGELAAALTHEISQPLTANRNCRRVTTTKPEATGLGLSLWRPMIESDCGRLTSRDDRDGTIVCFTLPIAGPKSEARA